MNFLKRVWQNTGARGDRSFTEREKRILKQLQEDYNLLIPFDHYDFFTYPWMDSTLDASICDLRVVPFLDLARKGVDEWDENIEGLIRERAEASMASLPVYRATSADGTEKKTVHLIIPFIGMDFIEAGVDFSGYTFPNNIKMSDGGEIICHLFFNGDSKLRNFSFRGCQFKTDFVFVGGHITEEIDFSQSEFHELAIIGYVQFDKELEFSNCQFHRVTYFYDINCARTANFGASEFKEYFSLSSSEFTQSVRFDASIFRNQAELLESEFQSHASFVEVIFLKYSLIEKCFIGRSADFSEAWFLHEKKFPSFFGSRFSESVILTHSHFAQFPDFRVASIGHSFSVDQVSFPLDLNKVFYPDYRVPPREKRLELGSEKAKKRANPEVVNFLKKQQENPEDFDVEIWKHQDSDGEDVFRSLKKISHDAHDHEHEQSFFTLELKAKAAKRKHKMDKVGWSTLNSYVYIWIYENLSAYGRSIFMPFLFLLWMKAFFAVLYSVMAQQDDELYASYIGIIFIFCPIVLALLVGSMASQWQKIKLWWARICLSLWGLITYGLWIYVDEFSDLIHGAAIKLSMMAGFPLLGLFRSKIPRLEKDLMGEGNEFSVYFMTLMGVQALLGTVCLFLIVLAIRNRFKIH